MPSPVSPSRLSHATPSRDRKVGESLLRPSSMAAASQASLLLQKQLRDLMKNPVDGFSAGLVDDSNVFEWSVTIIGPPDTLYDGGYFNAIMSFPSNYPNSPPTVRFTSEMWHPNVYPDGRVCISILHPPGDDPNGYELASERWMPVHTVESIVLSIISMLSSPNDESPANVEAAKEWRDTRDEFKKKVSRIVRRSQEMLYIRRSSTVPPSYRQNTRSCAPTWRSGVAWRGLSECLAAKAAASICVQPHISVALGYASIAFLAFAAVSGFRVASYVLSLFPLYRKRAGLPSYAHPPLSPASVRESYSAVSV
ncbi:hypothetical protein OPV22_017287 [Ensete ventricosum]|uniref:E2 ubiquitin-conjugating enzyme n=1 Tax=Ensete ventricosum TaxID=4639 RepID=A0AAV8QRS4_ENSVE|nr:hypothetical protein OPV22_017287 [Ensete ventricosum]